MALELEPGSAWRRDLTVFPYRDQLFVLQAVDPLQDIEEVDYFVMVMTVGMMLRGLGEILQQPRNSAELWAPYARQALAEAGKLEEVEKEIAAWRADA